MRLETGRDGIEVTEYEPKRPGGPYRNSEDISHALYDAEWSGFFRGLRQGEEVKWQTICATAVGSCLLGVVVTGILFTFK